MRSVGGAEGAVLAERDCRADQREMGEGLREVAELALGVRIVFLGEQPDIVAEGEQSLEERAGFVVPALEDQDFDNQNEQARKTPSPGGRPSTDSSSR
jgi:hypothetical protein